MKDLNKHDLYDMATRFCIDQELNINVELRNPLDRINGWALTMGRTCFSKTSMDFEYEPSPSNRDDEYMKDHRMSLHEALELAQTVMEQRRVKTRS